MAGGAGIIRAILDHQHRHLDPCRAFQTIGVAVIIGPLRQPRAQRGEAGQPDRPVVDHRRIAQHAPVRLALVGIDQRIDPARIAHRALNGEAALMIVQPARFQIGQLVLDPGGDPPVAGDLAGPVFRHKLGRERRLWPIRREQVPVRIAIERAAFILDRGVHPLGQRQVARKVRGQQQHAVRRHELRRDQIIGIARRGVGDPRVLRLGLIEQALRAPARPAAKIDLGIAQPLFSVADYRGEIHRRALHDQRGIVAAIAGVGIDRVDAHLGQHRHQRQPRSPADRMREDHHPVRRLGRLQVHRFNHHLADYPAVGVLEGADFLEGHQIGNPFKPCRHCAAPPLPDAGPRLSLHRFQAAATAALAGSAGKPCVISGNRDSARRDGTSPQGQPLGLLQLAAERDRKAWRRPT